MKSTVIVPNWMSMTVLVRSSNNIIAIAKKSSFSYKNFIMRALLENFAVKSILTSFTFLYAVKPRIHDAVGCTTGCMNSTCLIYATRHPTVSNIRASKNVQLQWIRNRPRTFQRAIDEVRTLLLTAPKGGPEMLIRCFTNKTGILSMKLCYKVSLH